MSNPDHRPDFLPGDPDFLSGDRNPPPDHPGGPDLPPPPPPRQTKRYPRPLVILGAVLVVVIVVGGFFLIRVNLNAPATPDPAAPPEDAGITLTPRSGTPAPLQTATPGERIQVQGLYGDGSVMVTRAEWSDAGALAPGPGREYLNVELRYDVAEGSMFVHPNYYTAYDATKTEYYPGIGSGKPQLRSQELKAGQSATGWVSIELPPGPATFVITDEGINPLVIVEIPQP